MDKPTNGGPNDIPLPESSGSEQDFGATGVFKAVQPSDATTELAAGQEAGAGTQGRRPADPFNPPSFMGSNRLLEVLPGPSDTASCSFGQISNCSRGHSFCIDPESNLIFNRRPWWSPIMKFLSRVVWSEGMHLGPHHFQTQSRYFEDRSGFSIPISARSHGISPLLSGF